MSTVNIHSKTFAATARLFGENNEHGQFATVDLDDGDLDVRIFLGTPAMCDELIKAAARAKSMLLGETSDPLPVLAEPPVSAQWAGERCPKTGRSASACDSPDHANCPDVAPERTATPAEHTDTAARIERARAAAAGTPGACLAESPDDGDGVQACSLDDCHDGRHETYSDGSLVRWWDAKPVLGITALHSRTFGDTDALAAEQTAHDIGGDR